MIKFHSAHTICLCIKDSDTPMTYLHLFYMPLYLVQFYLFYLEKWVSFHGKKQPKKNVLRATFLFHIYKNQPLYMFYLHLNTTSAVLFSPKWLFLIFSVLYIRFSTRSIFKFITKIKIKIRKLLKLQTNNIFKSKVSFSHHL